MVEKLNFGQSLFVHEDGRPISFYMRPCTERKTLKSLIEAGGGTISYQETNDCIKLLEPGSFLKSKDEFIKSQFVLDCAKANRLLDMSTYSSCSPAHQNCDDGMDPAPHVIKTTTASIKGRQKYTLAEDRHIVKYLVKEHRYMEVHGKKLWRDMALFQVTSHTAESMRTRYLKYILPNIHSYCFPTQWVCMVTGNTANSSCNKSDKTSPSTTSYAVQELVSEPDATLEEEDLESIFQPLSHQTSSSQKSKQPSSACNSLSSDQTPQMQTRSVLTSSSNLKLTSFDDFIKDNGSLDVEIASESEDEFDRILIETANCVQEVLNPAWTASTITKSSPGIQSSNIRLRRDENTAKETQASKQKLWKNKKLSECNIFPNKRCGKESDTASAENCPSTPDSYDRQLLECGHQFEKKLKRAFVVVDPLQDSDSPGTWSRKQNRILSPSPLKVNRSTKDSSITSHAKGKTPPAKGKLEKRFSNSLLSYVMQDLETESQLSQVACSQGHSDPAHCMGAISGSVKKGISLLEPALDETDSGTEVIRQEIQAAADSFDLTLPEIVHVLYINSGSLEDAIHWLMLGTDIEGYPAWSRHDDEILEGTDEEDYLAVEIKHGCKRVKVRREFLEWIAV